MFYGVHLVLRTIKNMFKSRGGSVVEEYTEVVTSQLGKELPDSLQYDINHYKDDAEFVRQVRGFHACRIIE